MLKVLIVDDTQEKIIQIRKVLADYVAKPNDVPVCVCIRDALKKCTKTRYDLVILDLYIPLNEGECPSPINAQNFLKLIKEDDDYICPVFVIGITIKTDITEYKSFFEAETMQVLNYSENDDTWKDQMKNRLAYLSGVKKKIGITYEYDYDVAIINALQSPEHEIMRKTLSDNWVEVILDDDNTILEMNPDDRPHDFAEVEEGLLRIYRDTTGTDYPRPEPEAAPDTPSLSLRMTQTGGLGMTRKV